MGWPLRGGHCHLEPPVCEPSDVVDGRVRRDAGQAVAQPVLATHGRIGGRTLWKSPAQIRWPREMAVPVIHRESPRHAPDRPPSPRLRTVTLRVVRQHLRRKRRHLLRRPRHPLLHRDCGCWDILA